MFILQALDQDRPWKVKDTCASEILKAVSIHFIMLSCLDSQFFDECTVYFMRNVCF